MILLDTDHVTPLKYPNSERGTRLAQRLDALPEDEVVGVGIVTIEEQMRGRQGALHQVTPYAELAHLFDFFTEFFVALFTEQAADQFDQLRTAKIRLGTMDLKIASIALVNQALLLSANRRDFQQVPRLRVENWLE